MIENIYGQVANPALNAVLATHRHGPLQPQFLWDETTVSEIESLLDLVSRPWWNRVWVIQKFALATIVTLCCGSYSVDWFHFRACLLTMVRIGQRSRHAYRFTASNSRLYEVFRSLTLKTFQALPFLLLSRANSPLIAAVGSFYPTFSSLLALTFNFSATNPRDYIYAQLGILPEDSAERKEITPDYSLSVRELYIRIAKYFLKSLGTLDVLSARPAIGSLLTMENLPSWVPDWSFKNCFESNESPISLTMFSVHKSIASLTQKMGGSSQIKDIPERLKKIKSLICIDKTVPERGILAYSPCRPILGKKRARDRGR